MTASSIIPRSRPRLQRPGRELARAGSAAHVVTHYTEQHSQALDVLGEWAAGNERRSSARAPGPRVIMHRPGEGEAERRAARNKILAFFGAMALALLVGTFAKPRAVATAQPAGLTSSQPETKSAENGGINSTISNGVELVELIPQVAADMEPAELQVGEHTFTEIAPEQSALLTAPGEQRTALISHYWPPLGGVNCATFVNGECVSNMASGLPWWAWVGRAAACPAELPFWTTITLPGGETFVCLDRGGKIVTTAAGELWIDLLVESAPVPYGAAMPVIVRYPWSEGQ